MANLKSPPTMLQPLEELLAALKCSISRSWARVPIHAVLARNLLHGAQELEACWT
jgi:hypothetical protein